MMTPIGKGQRGPDRRAAATAIHSAAGHRQRIPRIIPGVNDRLLSRRPEESTDMHARCAARYLATFGYRPGHLQVAEMVIEKARRLVEHNKYLDPARLNPLLACLQTVVRPRASAHPRLELQRPQPRIGSSGRPAHRNVGSLTIIATARSHRLPHGLIDFEEFKGTGNMEHLDRSSPIAVFPAIDNQERHRKEESYAGNLNRSWCARKVINLCRPPRRGAAVARWARPGNSEFSRDVGGK